MPDEEQLSRCVTVGEQGVGAGYDCIFPAYYQGVHWYFFPHALELASLMISNATIAVVINIF